MQLYYTPKKRFSDAAEKSKLEATMVQLRKAMFKLKAVIDNRIESNNNV